MIPEWLRWARELQAIAQTGLSYGPSDYDRERYEAVRRVATEIVAAQSGLAPGNVRELFAAEAGHATP